MKTYKIYIITNIINSKIYIGQTIQTGKNWKNYFGSGKLIRYAIKKYGKENFSKGILCTCRNKKEANDKEKLYIKLFNSKNKKYGYNISDGGIGGSMEDIYEETERKNKISNSLKKYYESMSELEKNERNKNLKNGWGKYTKSERRKIATKFLNGLTNEQISDKCRKISHSITKEQRSKIAKNQWSKLSSAERSKIAKKIHSKLSPAERSEIANKGWETRRQNNLLSVPNE